jgi:hypothetical protein
MGEGMGAIDAHSWSEGKGVRVNIGPPPPQANFKKLVYKNAIKPKIGDPPQAILFKKL